MQDFLLDTDFLFLCTILSGALLPLIVWLACCLRGRRARK